MESGHSKASINKIANRIYRHHVKLPPDQSAALAWVTERYGENGVKLLSSMSGSHGIDWKSRWFLWNNHAVFRYENDATLFKLFCS